MLLHRLSAVSRPLVRHAQSRGLRLGFGGCRTFCTGEGCVHPAEGGSAQNLYRDTVLVPRTDFPMKVTGQKLLDQEVAIQKVNGATVLRKRHKI